MHTKMILTALALVLSPPALGDDAPIVEAFHGRWVSDGDALGAPARSTMTWSGALGGAFTHLDYRIEMRPAGAPPSVFAGKAYYRHDGDGAYRAFWADSYGDLHPVAAVRDGPALVAHWGRAGAKQGRTRYELTAGDEMRVTDWVLTDDGWRMFNQNRFTRAPAGGE